ncbi:hypothetical protein QAD02_006353 [Eretmocerus hayati]|uniref:Uncharacterized protein n=1 Tax=Eretmocerus hayati TaxID=131215 RepID=A0ACC2N1S0_9HYME|nr:hypothetical protein QAD02_006353 [Eretmocerus hayati]
MDNPVMDAVQEDLTDFFKDDFADDEPWTNVCSDSVSTVTKSTPKIISNVLLCPASSSASTAEGNNSHSSSSQAVSTDNQSVHGQSSSLINEVNNDIFQDMLLLSSDDESSASISDSGEVRNDQVFEAGPEKSPLSDSGEPHGDQDFEADPGESSLLPDADQVSDADPEQSSGDDQCDPCMSPDPPAPIFLELFEPTPSHVCMRLIKAPPQLSSEKSSPAIQPEVRERSDICGHVPANSSEIVRSPGRRSSSLSHPINHMDFEEHSHSNVDGEFGYIEGHILASAGGAADSSVLAPGFHPPPSNQEPSHIHSPQLSPEKPPPAISAGGGADLSVLASGVHQLLSNQEPPHIHSQPQQSDKVEQIIVPRVQSIQSPKVVVITTDKVNSSSTEFPQQSGCSGFTSPSANPGHLGAVKSDCVDGLDSHEEKSNVSYINRPNMDPNQGNSSVMMSIIIHQLHIQYVNMVESLGIILNVLHL